MKKKIISIIVFLALLIVAFDLQMNFFAIKNGYIKNYDFYEYEEDFDVLFLGSSQMIMGISPMELWNDYGITSYNLANYGQWLPVNYWVLKNALDYTHPQLVVIDIWPVSYTEKYSAAHISRLHEVFDYMPLSINKILAVNDLLPESQRMEFLFSYSTYHIRWKEIDATFWEEVLPSAEKGGNLDNSSSSAFANVVTVAKPTIIDKAQINPEETTGKEYLRKMIELCQSQGIEVLLTALPFAPGEALQMWLNSVGPIAQEYHVDYLDMNCEDTFVNFGTDFWNVTHLNSSGAKKTTKVLGEYITDKFGIQDKRESAVAPLWNADYVEYEKYKIQWLQQQTKLEAYLMLLADDSYDVILEINDGNIFANKLVSDLLENLGVNLSQLTEKTGFIVIHDGIAEYIGYSSLQESVQSTMTGELRLQLEGAGELGKSGYSVYLNDEMLYNIPTQQQVDTFVRGIVLDTNTSKELDYATFAVSLESDDVLQTLSVNRK